MLRSKSQISIFFVVLFVSFILANNVYGQEVIWQYDTNMGGIFPAWVEELTIINDVSGNGIQEVIAGTKGYGYQVFCIEGETGSLIWDYPMSTKVGDLKTIEDLNGNGSQDVLVAEGFRFVIPPIPPVGPKLYCLDGETGVEIWSFTPDPQGFIPVLDIIPDVTGDGISDIIAGSDSCWVALVDGFNGNAVWVSSVPGQHIQAVSPIGDVDNDGLCDVLIGNWDNPGIETGSYCFSGADGAMLWERTIGDVQSNSVKSIPDINDDGIEDVIIGTMEGIMYAFSGTSFPPPIWQTATGTDQIIQEVVITQDITGDGKNEIIAGSWDDNVYCFDGASGSILWTYQVANWVHTVAITEDISGDGVKDILVGDRGFPTANGYSGAVYCLNGIDGTLLWNYETDHMVWAVSQIEDVNGNGAFDVVAGSDDGYVYCLEGNQNYIPLNPPQNLFVTDEGFATWDAPSSRDFIGYNVYLDGVFVVYTTDLFYQYTGLTNGQSYIAGVSAVYDEGESNIVEFEFTYTGTNAGNEIVPTTKLIGNHPNPFNPTTTISFSTTESRENTELAIYNLKGQKVKTLIDEKLPAGNHQVVWGGKDDNNKAVSSGIYFYKMNCGDYTSIKKMILMK